MQWADEAIVLTVRRHAETAAIAELFTRDHGRTLGLVHGGRSRRLRPLLQPGNHVDATWRARLDEHLGSFTIEPRRAVAAGILDQPAALLAVETMAALLHKLAEREPHPRLFEVCLFVIEFLDDPAAWPPVYARFELALLEDLGFGLDLSACAVTGATQELIYVSPKSGRAVCRAAGAVYADKLLRLPPFLAGGLVDRLTSADIKDALAISGHFLEQRVFAPAGERMPEVRGRLTDRLSRK